MSVERYNLFDNSFDGQFERKEEIETVGGKAEVVDVSPDHPKSEIPTFLAPAWSVSTEVYKPLIKMIMENDRRVVSIDHPRIGNDMEGHEEELAKYPKNELRKALTILDVLDKKDLEKVNAVAHSEAAINISIAAMLHPEKFNTISYWAPAGMIGEDNFTRLMKGFASQGEISKTLEEMNLPEPDKENARRVITDLIAYLLKNPVRAGGEVKDMVDTQIHPILRYLHSKGIPITVFAAADDPVFPIDRMTEIAKIDMLDGFLTVRGGHGIPVETPAFANAIEQMTTAMENKLKKAESEKKVE